MPCNHKKSDGCAWSNAQLETAVADVMAGNFESWSPRCCKEVRHSPQLSVLPSLWQDKQAALGASDCAHSHGGEGDCYITVCIVLQEFGFPLTKVLVGTVNVLYVTTWKTQPIHGWDTRVGSTFTCPE